MIELVWSKQEKYMEVFLPNGERHLSEVACVVRNELNGWRPNPDKKGTEEVVRTIPGNIPYMPRTFPEGKWNLLRVEDETDPYLAPNFIATDAWQMVEEWELKNGCYRKGTGKRVRDEGYGLHYSTSGTTIGCIKFLILPEFLWIVGLLRDIPEGEPLGTIEVMK